MSSLIFTVFTQASFGVYRDFAFETASACKLPGEFVVLWRIRTR